MKTYLNGELAALTATFKCQQIAYVSQTYQSCLGRVAHYIPGTILVGNGVMTAFSKDVYHFMWPKLVDGWDNTYYEGYGGRYHPANKGNATTVPDTSKWSLR